MTEPLIDIRVWWPFMLGALVICAVTVGIWVMTLRAAVRRAATEMIAARDRDSEAEARYRGLFEGAGDAVWETDATGCVVALNPAGEKLFAVGPGEALGQPVARFLVPGDWGRVRPSGVRRATDPFEIVVAPPNREPVTVELSARALSDGRVQAIARDVTERKRLQDRAAHGQRLEALGRLAGGVAHDFNNVLTVIASSAEVLKTTVEGNAQAVELANRVIDAAARAGRMTRQLLTFGRVGLAPPVSIDLAAAVGGCADLLRGLTAGRVILEFDLAADTPWILADPALLEQILLNLVVNARDASRPGDTVTVTTTPEVNHARLSVTDRGIGMDAATQARVFEPFFTTKPHGEGTGLGLATVYGAVQSLGGLIRLRSSPGAGTTFEIDLPVAARAKPRPPSGDFRIERTVLIVEDDDAVREVTRLALDQAGFRLLVASCGPNALELAGAHKGPIDLVLSDVMMPHYTGRELAERLRSVRPKTRVLFMSGYPGDELRSPAGDDFFLAKPFTASELVAKVREVLE